MTPSEVHSADLANAARDLRTRDEPFAFATIVRTAGSTAAKPGAKALLSADGSILHGWLGGGCTRGAVKRAAIAALRDGTPQLISIAPEDLLTERGVRAGEMIDGLQFARNGCPSRGTVDIFIEPCLPSPQLVVLGTSPVAEALARLAPHFGWDCVPIPPDPGKTPARQRVIVVATQGQGDMEALKAALATPALHIAFVGSILKSVDLSARLVASGMSEGDVARIKAPAGLDIGAVTPEEIALSILAELVRVRRIQRTANAT